MHVVSRQQIVGHARTARVFDVGQDVLAACLLLRRILRNVEAEQRQSLAQHRDGIVQPALQLVLVRLDQDASYLQQRSKATRPYLRIDRLGGVELAAQIGRFRRPELQVEPESGVASPCVRRQQAEARAHVLQCGREGRRAPRLGASAQVHLRQLYALAGVEDQRAARVELIDDLE